MMSELVRERGEYCAGISETLTAPSERIKYWQQAAASGHLPSMLQYASGSVFKRGEVLQVLDSLETYKRTALSMMRQVAANGSLDANLLLARAYYPGADPRFSLYGFYIGQVVDRKDGARSLAYYLLSQQLLKEGSGEASVSPYTGIEAEVNNSIADLKRFLTPEEWAEGNRTYQSLSAQLKLSPDGLVPVLGFGTGTRYPSSPDISRCSKASFVR